MEQLRSFERRWAVLERAMEKNQVDVVLIYGKGIITQYGYLYYFGGYYPVLRPGFIVYARGEQPIAFYSTRADCYLAKETGQIDDVRFSGTGNVIDSERELLTEVSETINAYSPSKVGIVGLKSLMTPSQKQVLISEIHAEIVDVTPMAANIKAFKSDEELEGVRNAFRLAEKSYNLFKDTIRAGRTPAEIAGEIERIARGHGAIDTLIFIEEGPYFLRKPTLQPLSNNKLITAYVELIDANGYWVEKAGLFALGDLDPESLRIGEACVAAMNEVKRSIGPGKTAGQIAETVSKHGKSLNLHTGIWHGHGVGVDHDIPIIADGSDEVLNPGMVVSVHPNFADEEKNIGASIADLFFIHKDKSESLSRLSYDIIQL